MDTRWTVCSYHFWSQYTVPCSDPSLLSILSQHIIIPEVSVLFVESRFFFSHISALLLSNFVATDVYALSLKFLKSLPAVFFPYLVWAKFWVPLLPFGFGALLRPLNPSRNPEMDSYWWGGRLGSISGVRAQWSLLHRKKRIFSFSVFNLFYKKHIFLFQIFSVFSSNFLK